MGEGVYGMVIKKVESGDSGQFFEMVKEIEDNLASPAYWLPMTEIAKEHFFDDTWTYFLGAYEGEKLIGAVGLFFNEYEYGESADVLQLDRAACAEIGRAMVRPQYRGRGLMRTLAEKLIALAKEKGIENLIATVHPQNMPSQKTFLKLGFEKKAHVVKLEGFERDIFWRGIG